MTWRKGESGNPNGKRPGTLARLARQADELAKQHGYDPFEKQIRLSQRIEAIVQRNHFKDPLMRLRYFEFLQRLYRDTMPYLYPQLKAIEITDDIGAALDERTIEEQREGLAFLLRQVQELADEEGLSDTHQGAA